MPEYQSLLILGSGYVGKRLSEYLARENFSGHLFETHQRSELVFDLGDETTWKNLPKVDASVWTFPAAPLSSVRKFLEIKGASLGRVVVLGSTSSFQIQKEDQLISEASALDFEDPRVQGEEELRSRGAIIVHSAGIYGPGRNPLRWFKLGKLNPTKKFLNLIHVDDLVQFLWKSLLKGRAGARYIAADGNPFRRAELFEKWTKEFGMKVEASREAKAERLSVCVDPSQSIRELEIQLKYPNVLEGVRDLERQ